MRKLIAVLSSLLLAVSPAYAQKTKANLITELGTNLPDNTTGLITPAILRTTLTDMINSWYGLIDTTNSGTGQVTAGGFALSTVPAANVLQMSGTYTQLSSTDANENIFLGTQAADPSILYRGTTHTWQNQAGISVATLSTGTAPAFSVGRAAGNVLTLQAQSTGNPLSITATGVDANIQLLYVSKGASSHRFFAGSGTDAFAIAGSTTSVNFLQASPAPTTGGPQLAAVGSDTNISLNLLTKGTGTVNLQPSNGVSGALSFQGNTSGFVVISAQAAAGTYNFNLPTTAGNVNQVLTSQGGGSTAMTWQNVATGTPVQTVTKQVFTASGTYTPHAGLIVAVLECVGAGGGGGGVTGVAGSNVIAGPGASGGYSRSVVLAATIGASKTVTVGTHGTGGAAGNNSGSGGGASCFTSTSCVSGQIVSANGGGAGTFGVNTGAPAPGGAAGTGDIAAAGNPGGPPQVGTTALFPFPGASSHFGGGATAPTFVSSTALTGINASNYGSGGSGAWAQNITANAAGGNGSDGICIATEYNNQ